MKKIQPLKNLHGEIQVPGDKSISHRAIMLASLGSTPVEIENFLMGADCLSTIECMRAMGVNIREHNYKIFVKGKGMHGLREPENVLDAGNSGTTLRLLLGLTAPQNFIATFTGDASLCKRPMARVIKPLTEMGASIVGRNDNQNLPITVCKPAQKLHAITYELPVASAQVKSSIILAAIYADGITTIIEPAPSRDHTERMLEAFGVQIEREGNTVVKISPAENLTVPEKIVVPGDISSAAWWIVLATILEGSRVTIKNVGINKTRTGLLDALTRMGAQIEIRHPRESGGETSADLKVTAAKLRGIEFGGVNVIPRLIDEIPALAVAAAFAEGDTVIHDVGELRVKETDRLAAIVSEFNKISRGSFEAKGDTLIIHGGAEKNFAECKTYGDHRMAMALSIFGAAAAGVKIDDAACVSISYPNFFETIGD